MGAIGWVMIAYSSNCLISQEWLTSIAEGDSIINATLLTIRIAKSLELQFIHGQGFSASLMLLYEVTGISVKTSSFEVEFKEKLYEKYSKSQKYLIPKEEYYKILEDLQTTTEFSSTK